MGEVLKLEQIIAMKKSRPFTVEGVGEVLIAPVNGRTRRYADELINRARLKVQHVKDGVEDEWEFVPTPFWGRFVGEGLLNPDGSHMFGDPGDPDGTDEEKRAASACQARVMALPSDFIETVGREVGRISGAIGNATEEKSKNSEGGPTSDSSSGSAAN